MRNNFPAFLVWALQIISSAPTRWSSPGSGLCHTLCWWKLSCRLRAVSAALHPLWSCPACSSDLASRTHTAPAPCTRETATLCLGSFSCAAVWNLFPDSWYNHRVFVFPFSGMTVLCCLMSTVKILFHVFIQFLSYFREEDKSSLLFHLHQKWKINLFDHISLLLCWKSCSLMAFTVTYLLYV